MSFSGFMVFLAVASPYFTIAIFIAYLATHQLKRYPAGNHINEVLAVMTCGMGIVTALAVIYSIHMGLMIVP